jgi:hypothetical protein
MILTSQLGIRLILLIGKAIPLPAPYNVSSSLTSVEVTNDAEQGDGFQMTFTMSKDLVIDYSLLLSGMLDPFTRVVIGVLIGAIPQVLIDGVITHHQVAPSSDPGMSTLTVTGKDVTTMLDLQEKNASYENQPDFLIVLQLIAQYALYGLVPVVTPTTDIPIMLDRIPRQHETDLKFIQRLAQKNGYVFYIEPLTIGANTAYWGPENRASVPQSALTMNMGTMTNVKSLHFSQDALAPVGTTGTFVEPITKISIPIPALPSLRVPPLVPFPTQARRTVLLRDTANQNPGQAATAAVAAETRAPDSVTGEGELNTIYYGNVLRARRLVGVRGVGFSYDGLYYVRRVTHTLSRGEYTQKFTVSREGTGALLPAVIP